MRFIITISLSAFLLFQIQPLLSKHILPWFGGSPAVWTTCLLFFQVVLLAGYGYAYWLASWKSRRKQMIVHMLLLAFTLLLIPVFPNETWKPEGGESATWQVLGLLTMTVGGPYFLLATTGPLLQAWFSISNPGQSPYRLYAVSNAGSLLGLITYPFIFDPVMTRHTQVVSWSGAYAVFVIACAWCSWKLMQPTAHQANNSVSLPYQGAHGDLKNDTAIRSSAQNKSEALLANGKTELSKAGDHACPPRGSRAIGWLLMATCGSIFLLSTTNQICQNLAVVPFLWVLPLSLYLASFIIPFGRAHLYRRGLFILLFAVFSVLACIIMRLSVNDIPIYLQIPVYISLLFAGCMICHGELERIKPDPKYLTYFYLVIATGGALGGLFVAVAAPYLFPGYWEYHIAIAGTGALILIILFTDPSSNLFHGKNKKVWILYILFYLGVIAGLVNTIIYEEYGTLVGSRSFYGVLHITEWEDEKQGVFREMYHGNVVHGTQYENYPLRYEATTYYGRGTGGWLAINSHPRRLANESMNIGVLGLGTGTISVLGRGGDVIRYYEINPDVIEFSDEWFSYSLDTLAHIETVLGDARIQLERELDNGQSQQFDVLIADAFSSEAIPLHLLTVECAKIYRQHLKDDGILAIHISNDYLDLVPVTIGIAETLNWEMIVVHSDEDEEQGIYAASWVLLTANRAFLDSAVIRTTKEQLEDELPNPVFWTDEYASLFHIVTF